MRPNRESKYISLVLFSLTILFGCDDRGEQIWSVTSPEGNISAKILLQETDHLVYQIFTNGESGEIELIEPSQLGIVRDDEVFDSLRFAGAEKVQSVDEEYTLATGKKLKNRNHYNELTLHFENHNAARFSVVFRAYDQGVAFRYVFPEESDKPHTVLRELTAFNLAEGSAWMQPYDSSTAYAPAYERNYAGPMEIGTEAPFDDGWCFPALFETRNHWVLLTEANVKSNFFGSHLHQHADNGVYRVVPPNEDEAFGYGNSKAVSTLPWEMPWRVIFVGDELADIVESNLVTHVSDPSVIEDASWIQPGRASWGWWSGYLDKSRDTPEKLKRFIDFAHAMGWEYSLVDAGWDTRKGLNIEELVKYAKDRNVKLLLWYNSGGPINRVQAGPRDRMYDPGIRKEEMQWLAETGIAGIKIDFFGSDKQDFISLYQDILKDAATYKLLINFHGATIPRGWSRTYPNLISLEAVKGSEAYIYHRDFQVNAPMHNTILPFTRNVVGPMDYTPVAFSVQQVPHRTSYGHELALSVVFESGIQHFADRPETYMKQPVQVIDFLKAVPAAWDDTRFVAGYPGTEVVIARRKGDNWFIGGINGEDKAKELGIGFDFLDEGVTYAAQLITDGEKNTQFASRNESVMKDSTMKVSVLPIGGFVMRLSPLHK